MFWIALGVLLWPVSAWATDGKGAPALTSPGARISAARSPDLHPPAIVLGCFSDTDCVKDAVCVREEGLSDGEPGTCVASFDEEDVPVVESPDAQPPPATLQCHLAIGGPDSTAMGAFLTVIALALSARRTKKARGAA